jgi:hypothetical protein
MPNMSLFDDLSVDNNLILQWLKRSMFEKELFWFGAIMKIKKEKQL